MSAPQVRAFCLGEVSDSGRQFLSDLESARVIDVTFENNVQRFCENTSPLYPHVVFVEKTADSFNVIQAVRKSLVRTYICYFGHGFTRDEMMVAMKNRVYAVIESPNAKNEAVVNQVRKVAQALTFQSEYEHVVHSLKAALFEGDEGGEELAEQFRAGIAKLERAGMNNELLTLRSQELGVKNDGEVPFHKSQSLADALIMMHDLERTGSLSVYSTEEGLAGTVDYVQGKIVGAKAGAVHGTKAVYRMFLWDQVNYRFTKKALEAIHIEEDIAYSVSHLCEQGEAMRNRYQEIRSQVPPGVIRLELIPSSLHIDAVLNENEFETLASVVEFGRVGHVLDYNPLDDVALFESLIGLRKKNLIRVLG